MKKTAHIQWWEAVNLLANLRRGGRHVRPDGAGWSIADLSAAEAGRVGTSWIGTPSQHATNQNRQVACQRSAMSARRR